MEHQSLHGQDLLSFSSSSPHRMPTVSAAQALQDLNSPTARSISTGLPGLDCALRNRDASPSEASTPYGGGGVSSGQVTEVYGPPGVGKTALGIQLVASALHAGRGVVWVDATHPLPGPRLTEVVSSLKPTRDVDRSTPTEAVTTSGLLKGLTHFVTPTLPHFLALLCHSTSSFPSQNTSLIVIDSPSALISSAYPKTFDNGPSVRKPGILPKYEPQTWAASRKWSVLQYIISALQKLATLRNIAIVLLNQSVTKMQSGERPILVSAISSTAWDAGIATSIVLFRGWGREGRQVRYAKVQKADGVAAWGKRGVGKVVAFTIESHGLEEFQLADTDVILEVKILSTPSRKRKAAEIGDSEEEENLEGSDEDYGWAEEDNEELPQPPPQWQGSEDILVPGEVDEERGDGDDDDDGEGRDVEEEEVGDSEQEDEEPLA